MCGYPQFSLWIPIALGIIYLSHISGKNTSPALVSTVLKNRRSTTAPDRLISDIFRYNTGKTPHQCQEGLRLEPIIKEKYIAKHFANGHIGKKVSEKGLIIDGENPLLTASIDGEVYDPTAKHCSPIGNLELNINNFPADYVQNRKLGTINLLVFIAKHAN